MSDDDQGGTGVRRMVSVAKKGKRGKGVVCSKTTEKFRCGDCGAELVSNYNKQRHYLTVHKQTWDAAKQEYVQADPERV